MQKNNSHTDGNAEFATTQWQIVRGAADSDSGVRSSALATLCEKYWYPLYAYVRRLGNSHEESTDLTQAFFADLLERGDLEKIDPNLGKFRSFLLASIRNFVNNQWKRQRAEKRGGGHAIFSINFGSADERYAWDPEHNETAESVFEREWAVTLIQRVQTLLEKDFADRGKKYLYDVLKVHLSGKSSDQTLAQAASKCGITEVAAKVSVHRMRERFGEILRQEIRNTLDDETDIEAEITHLFSVLRT